MVFEQAMAKKCALCLRVQHPARFNSPGAIEICCDCEKPRIVGPYPRFETSGRGGYPLDLGAARWALGTVLYHLEKEIAKHRRKRGVRPTA